jgi:hypothetical protein
MAKRTKVFPLQTHECSLKHMAMQNYELLQVLGIACVTILVRLQCSLVG